MPPFEPGTWQEFQWRFGELDSNNRKESLEQQTFRVSCSQRWMGSICMHRVYFWTCHICLPYLLFPNGPPGFPSCLLGPTVFGLCDGFYPRGWSIARVCLRIVSSITSVSRNVLHFNCILKEEASHTQLPLGDSVCSTIDLFIIHSLIPSGKIKTATWSCWWTMRQNSREETVLVLDFNSGCLLLAVWPWATHLISMGLGFSPLWNGVLSVLEWGVVWVDRYLWRGDQGSLLNHLLWSCECGHVRNLVWCAQLQDHKL